MQLQHLASGPPAPDPWRADAAHLWARVAALLAALIARVASPAQIIGAPCLTPQDRRLLDRLIAPIEALIRLLLMSDAIAWLLTTEEGAAELARAQQPPPSATPSPLPCAREQRETSMPAETARPPSEPPGEDGIARLLAPAHLRFRLYDTWGRTICVCEQPPPPRREHAAPRRRRFRCAATRLARRIEAVRLILVNPRPAMLALARDLARIPLHGVYVPSVRNMIDRRWLHGRLDNHAARLLARARFLFLDATRDRLAIRALPPPEPG